jgi:hypothetical protein
MSPSKFSRRAWFAIGGMIGYVPTPKSWPDSLRKLRGEFALSVGEQSPAIVVALLCFGAAGGMLSSTFEQRGISPSGLEREWLIAGCILFCLMGLCIIFLYRIRYVFDSGTLKVLIPGGYPFREYDLKSLKSVSRMRGKVVDSLRLHWDTGTHRILLPSSLISALSRNEGI